VGNGDQTRRNFQRVTSRRTPSLQETVERWRDDPNRSPRRSLTGVGEFECADNEVHSCHESDDTVSIFRSLREPLFFLSMANTAYENRSWLFVNYHFSNSILRSFYSETAKLPLGIPKSAGKKDVHLVGQKKSCSQMKFKQFLD
jgi:hypothetical protein